MEISLGRERDHTAKMYLVKKSVCFSKGIIIWFNNFKIGRIGRYKKITITFTYFHFETYYVKPSSVQLFSTFPPPTPVEPFSFSHK